MIESLRRHLRAVLISAVVILVVLPPVMLALSAAQVRGAPIATRGPIQALCQPIDPNSPAQIPALPVIAEIHNGPDAAYLLAGPGPAGLNYVTECQTSDGMFASSGGGLASPPIDALLSLDHGGGLSSDIPDRLYAGHVGPTVTRVEAMQASGATVDAKVASGWYLIWTRTVGNLVRITAFDAKGAIVRVIEDPNGLMPPR